LIARMKKRYYRHLSGLCIALAIASELFTPVEAQPKESKVVLQVGDRRVSRDEFVYRLSFVPHLNEAEADSIRIQALVASMIAEKIFALEALQIRLDTVENCRDVLMEHKNEAIYEQWMQKEISEKVHITSAEIDKAYSRFVEQRTVDYLVFSDASSASRAYDTLCRYRDFSQFITSDGNPLFETKTLEYGESLVQVEDQIYSMTSDQISKVVPIDGKFYIFKLKRIEPHPVYSKQNLSYWKPSVEKRLKARKEASQLSIAAERIMASKKFSINRNTYEFVLKEVAKRIPFGKKELLELPEAANREFATIPHDVSEHFNEPFLRFRNDEVWTVGDFWKKLRMGPFLLNYRSEQDLKNDFSHLIRTMVILETIVENGKQLGFDHDGYVVDQTRMWNDDLMSRLFQYSILDPLKTQGEQGTDNSRKSKDIGARLSGVLQERSKRYSITIQKDVLKDVKVPKHNMLVRKSHFPNRFAVPLSTPIDHKAPWFQQLWNSQ
jgi:hypothetical protein